MWLLPQKHVLEPKIRTFWLFFFVGKNPLLHVAMMKKIADEVSLLFGHLKVSENLEESVKMPQKSKIRQKVSITLPDTLERTNVSSSSLYKLLHRSPIPHY